MVTIPRLIIDTDMSTDDLMAIPDLLNRRGIEIIGITATWNWRASPVARSYERLAITAVSWKSYPGIPVSYGDEQPTDGYFSFPEEWRAGLLIFSMVLRLPKV